MKQQSIDYEQCLFQCKTKKKQLIGKENRFIYVFEDRLIINRNQNKGDPARVISFENIIRVKWNYSINPKTFKTFLKSFTLETNNNKELLKYYADFEMLIALKKILQKFVQQSSLEDEYETQQVLGEGSYAVVFQLKNIFTGQQYAGKCIEKKKLDKIDKGLKAVMNEIEIMRILSPHAQIVNLHEVYDGVNSINLVLDLCSGENLQAELTKRNLILEDSEIKIIMHHLLLAVDYIHSKGVMHRDLKPENILFQKPQDFTTLKIGDFGLAAIQTDTPYLYPKCGTPGFVAPEIANLVEKDKEYSRICDIFSCGAIFHLLLFGEGVFPGKGHLELLKLNKECNINPDDKRYDILTIEQKDLLFKMLKTNPDHRPFAKDLLNHPYFTNQKLNAVGIFSMNVIKFEDDNTLVMQDQIHSPTKIGLEKRFSFLQMSNERNTPMKII
ncbi:unnamed protein product (macronuclear) [Paramecium tetraurelia]|uniref:Protein kinase domain-containing protein n=1 Tax=Paramecium tetraurelia TaxID=5888 RepID=A0CT37_PARTE|nr:uncharacterized protein GSPATT00010187001 [Paramecium tetraurelia]CAK73954.1 unnamed protein product [Paramecium tetraurelia]|eukprot:XP_001441351.1 hypothetical protein (macronuclear) [Paramecium tetraurelia strain d4-2]